MRYLLDTSALLAHYRQEHGWEMVQAVFEDDEAEIIVASVSLPEFGRRLRDLGASATIMQETLTNYQLLCAEVAPVGCRYSAGGSRHRQSHPAPVAATWTPSSLPSRRYETQCSCTAYEHMRSISPALLQQNDLSAPADPR